MHTDLANLRRLAVITNDFHMARVRAVFKFVFELPPQPLQQYQLKFISVADQLPDDVVKIRQNKEQSALPRFLPGGVWQSGIRNIADLHKWINNENTAYAVKRLLM